MLTLFTIPKSFHGHTAIIQRNAIRSWMLLRPECEIILLGDDEGTEEVAREFGLLHLPQVSRNEHGTPLINSIFEVAQQAARHRLVCYVNADIILMNDFIEAAQTVARSKRRFLMVGQRWDIEITSPMEFGAGWDDRLRRQIVENAELHPATGMDYFLFPRGSLGKILPLAIGRTVWDNWLLYLARSQRMPLIDATQVVMAVHQNHDYLHLRNGIEEAWTGLEAQNNLALAGGYDHVYTIQDATLLLTTAGLVPAPHPLHPQRRRTSILAAWLEAKVRRILSPIKRLLRTFSGRAAHFL